MELKKTKSFRLKSKLKKSFENPTDYYTFTHSIGMYKNFSPREKKHSSKSSDISQSIQKPYSDKSVQNSNH